MMSLNNRSIAARLGLGFGASVILLLVVAASTSALLHEAGDTTSVAQVRPDNPPPCWPAPEANIGARWRDVRG